MPKKWHDIFPITCDINLIATGHVESVCLLSRVSNRKPDAQIKLTLDMDDYYRIKDTKSGESDE